MSRVRTGYVVIADYYPSTVLEEARPGKLIELYPEQTGRPGRYRVYGP